MGTVNNMTDLFHHQLKDLYSAETQLVKALSEMEEKAENKELKNAFSKHLNETKEHKKRLEEIGQSLNVDMKGEKCEAMEGLIKEAKNFVKENPQSDVRDAGIIAEAQRIEHYEISAYGTVVHYAKVLKKQEIANMLQETLDEESRADQILNQIAVDNINKQAQISA